MSIFNSPYFLFRAGSLKGKTRKEIETFFESQKKKSKKQKKKHGKQENEYKRYIPKQITK